MSRVESNNTASRTVVARINPVTGRLIDPRVVAVGNAMLTMCEARADLSRALRDLGIDPDPITDLLLTADDLIDAALARH
jgi:hypothetical protein